MNVTTRASALKTLDGMRDIAEREMLQFGSYFTRDVVNPQLRDAGAICGGRQACLIGSAYFAYGVKVPENAWHIPGVWPGAKRERFLRRRPGLRVAIDALNQAAMPTYRRGSDKFKLYAAENYEDSPAEALFEVPPGQSDADAGPYHRTNAKGVTEQAQYNWQRRHVLRLIAKARKTIEEAV